MTELITLIGMSNRDSFLKIVKVILLLAVVLVQAGCASDEAASGQPVGPANTQSKDDLSHGWGPAGQ
jgi:hypothetical protein